MLHDRVEDLSAIQGASVRYLLGAVSSATSKDALQTTLSSLEQIASRGVEYGRFTIMAAVGAFVANRNEKHQAIAAKLVTTALEKSNGLTLVAAALDEANTTVSKDSLFSLMASDLKLTPSQQLTFATALSLGSATAKTAATEFLESFNVPQALLKDGGDAHTRAAALLARQVGTLNALDVQLAPACSTAMLPVPTSPAPAQVSVANVLRELGTGCVTTLADSRELLSIFPNAFTERDVADVLGFFASQGTAPNDGTTYTALMMASGKSAPKSVSGNNTIMNAMPLLDALHENNASMDWDHVIKLLDQPTEDSFKQKNISVIFDAYHKFKSGGSEYPAVNLFLGRWANASRQRGALEYIVRHPDKVNRKQLTLDAPAELLPATKPAGMTAAEMELWRSFAFVEAAVHVAGRDKDFNADVFRPAAEKLPLLFLYTLFLGTYPGTIKNFTTIKHILANHCPPLDQIATSIIPEAEKHNRLDAVISMLSELTVSFPNRTVDVLEMVLKCKSVVKRFLKGSGSPRLVVALAMCMDEAGEPSDKWLQRALEGKLHARAGCTENRFSVAMGIVEVAEMLHEKKVYVASATAALNALLASPIKDMLKSVVECARALLASTDSLFPEDVEKEATDFFKAMYKEGTTVNAVAKIETLLKSSNARDRQLYACIVSIMFEESTAITDYPRAGLRLFATLYGQMIAKELLPVNQQQRAWGILLPAIVRPSNYATEEYGVLALEQIKPRIADWPQYCRTLRHVKDLDFRVPGIVAAINRGIKQEETAKNAESNAAAGEGVGSPASSALPVMDPAIVSAAKAPDAQQLAKAHDAAKLHTVDITTLVTNKNVTAPPRVIQEQMNFLIGNTDIHKLDSNARELSLLLRPEYYEYFADYLVVKRAALEPNYHGMYIELVNKLHSKELERTLRLATIAAVKRLLASEKIRTDTSERMLLRHLGMWLGAITLEKNIPVLQQDLSFKDLMLMGLREGKLIGVVAFVTRVLNSCANSAFFACPNPWTMSQLCLLYEMYNLKHLRITLRFEVELLCNTLKISLPELDEYARIHQFRGPNTVTLEDVWKTLDLDDSPDFNVGDGDGLPDTLLAQPHAPPSQPQMSPSPDGGMRPSTRPLQASAEPFQPKDVSSAATGLQNIVSSLDVPIRPPVEITPEKMHIDSEEEKIVGPQRIADYRRMVATLLLEAVNATLQSAGNRHVTVAVLTTMNLTIKDFTRDAHPEDLLLGAEAMSRSLAASLCFATAREAIPGMLAPAVAATITNGFPEISADAREQLARRIVENNTDLCVRALEYLSGEEAAKQVRGRLADAVREKAMSLATNQPLPIPPDQVKVMELLNVMGESLVPTGRLPAPHREIYTDYFNTLPVISLFTTGLRGVEEAVNKYYAQESYTPLDIASEQFLESTNENSAAIRQRLSALINFPSEAAIYYVGPLFQKVMAVAETLDRLGKEINQRKKLMATHAAAVAAGTDAGPAPPENTEQVRAVEVATVLNQIYLFILQYCLERGGASVREEFTRLYLKSDERYSYTKLTTDLIRFKIINTQRLDEDLARALLTGSSSQWVTFAGDLINNVILKDKLASGRRDLRQTLAALDGIARSRNAHRPPVPSSPAFVETPPLMKSVDASITKLLLPITLQGEEKAEEVSRLLDEWITVWSHTRSHRHPTEERNQSVEFVRTLQQHGLLETSSLSAFLCIGIRLAVEHYSTVSLELERENAAQAEALAVGKKPGAPPAYRTPHSAKAFVKCDAFTDLVFVLLRCCSLRNDSLRDQRAELTLLRRVLEMFGRVLSAHHDAVARNQVPDKAPGAGAAYVTVFQQQPYVRLLSNMLLTIQRQEASSSHREISDGITQAFQMLLHRMQPCTHPAFAFGWLEIVAHRVLIPRCIRTPERLDRYTELLIDALRFNQLLTAHGSITPNGLVFYKSVFKLMLILLHDYPQFLISQHFPLCDAIPPHCVQMLNTVLCSFPPDMRLPEPFQHVASDHPDMLKPLDTTVQVECVQRTFAAFKDSLDITALDRYLSASPGEKMVEADMKPYLDLLTATTDNWRLMSALVMHVAHKYLETHAKDVPANVVRNCNAMRFYRYLCKNLPTEHRYHFLCSCARHLRYPNIQTNFFAQVIYCLFRPDPTIDAKTQTCIQEQITRVVAEKTVVVQPHPWGVLNTFVEIMSNPEFDFWSKSFTHAPQLEAVFVKLRRTVDSRHQGSNPTANGAKK